MSEYRNGRAAAALAAACTEGPTRGFSIARPFEKTQIPAAGVASFGRLGLAHPVPGHAERSELRHGPRADQRVGVALEGVVEHQVEGHDEPADRDRDGGHHHQQQAATEPEVHQAIR